MSFDLKIEQGDLVIGEDGDLKKVENSEKLIQDILKIAISPLGGNLFFPFYGSPLSRTTIGSVLDNTFLGTIASNQLRNSLETLQKLQKNQQKQGQKVTAQELLATIKEVTIEQNQIDPRFFRVFIQVLAKDLNIVTISFDISL